MKYRFSAAAQREFDEAVAYYSSCTPGLGLDFANEILSILNVVCSFPDLWAYLEKPVRRALVHRFPFGVLYVVEPDDVVLVLAVMHLHRKPSYWKEQ